MMTLSFNFHLISYHICQEKRDCLSQSLLCIDTLVGFQPLLDLGLSQAQDILSGVGRCLTAANMQEIQALGSLVQVLFVAGRIAQLAERVSLDQSSGLGIIFLLADDLLHEINLLSNQLRMELLYTFLSGNQV